MFLGENFEERVRSSYKKYQRVLLDEPRSVESLSTLADKHLANIKGRVAEVVVRGGEDVAKALGVVRSVMESCDSLLDNGLRMSHGQAWVGFSKDVLREIAIARSQIEDVAEGA